MYKQTILIPQKCLKHVGPCHECHPLHKKPRKLRLVSLQLQKQDYHDHLGPRCPHSGFKWTHIADGKWMWPKRKNTLSKNPFRLIHPSPFHVTEFYPKRSQNCRYFQAVRKLYHVVIFHDTWDLYFIILIILGSCSLMNNSHEIRVWSAT